MCLRSNVHLLFLCGLCTRMCYITSSKPHTKYGKVCINTARHVVYDESEAVHTTCYLYFDRGGTPQTCEGVVALNGMHHGRGDGETDEYDMFHYTHDLDLAHRLEQRCWQRRDLKSKLKKKARYNLNFKWSRPAPDKQPLLFIVSHPHGCSKQISIGRCHSLLPLSDNQCDCTYTTATCPGSSGAAVNVLYEGANSYWVDRVSLFLPVHHGVCNKQPGMNLALLYYESLFPEMVSVELHLRYEEGLWEDTCYVEYEDLCKHYDTCQRNPGHHNFFPVDKFSVDHLPPCECKDKIMELFKVLSELTVRVAVRYVSEQRPETVPGTDIPYPWYSYRGSNQMRLGSGRITDVEFPHTRARTQQEFACINIVTAAHLVYDKLEGEQTTCHLFFDSGETPKACKDVVTLTNARSTETDIVKDRCTLTYCTHDLSLAHKLRESLKLYFNLKDQCYRSYNREIVKQNDRNNLTANPPLNIVVSHPHGSAKHVSISYPGCHDNTDTEEFQRPYKSITCPGSSGAPFITLDPQPLYPCFE